MATKNIAGITAKLGLDVTGVTSALNQIEKKSKDIAREMAEVDKSLKFDPTNVVLAAQKQDLLAEAIKNTEAKLKELESVQQKTNNAFRDNKRWEQQYAPLGAAIDETNEKLKKLQQQNEKMNKDFADGKITPEKYKEYQDELEATKAKMKELQKQKSELEATFEDGHITADEYRAYQREVENTKRQLADLRAQQNSTGKSAEELGKSAKGAGEGFKNAKGDVKSYEDAVSGLKTAIGDVSNDLKGIVTVASGAVAAVGTAAVGAVSEAVKVGASFEQSMSKVQAISGATGDELEALKQAAKDMGASTSKTAAESADALSYMALAGWKTNEMLTGLEPILRASEAGEMDLATCSDLVTDSMSAMGVEVNDLAHYLDVVAAAQSNSNTSMQQLLEAFVECGGSAHNFRLNVEDLSTVLGVMANRGIKGSEAGTALNSIFVNMLGSTAKTAEAMSALGLLLYDETGSMKNMTEVLKEMGAALESSTDQQRNSLEAMLGGKTQITALQALVNGLNGEYDNLTEKLYNCDGALKATAETMQDNLIGKVTIMKSSLEALGGEVYEYLEEPLKSAVQSATKEITDLSNSVKDGQLSETIKQLADRFGEFIKKTAEFATSKGIPEIIDSLDWISQNGDKIIAVIEGMGAGLAAWKIGTMVSHVVNLVKAIQDFKAAQEAATAAQIAANAAAKANIYIAVASAVATLAVSVGSLLKAKYDEKKALEESLHALSDETIAYQEQAEACKKSTDEAEKNIKTIDHNADTMQSLWNEIKLLVDEEGRAIGSSEGLESAISRLNAISGQNIEVVNGQITGYKDLKASMDDIIEAQRRQAKLDYLQEDYVNAVYNVDAMKEQQAEVLKQKEEFQRQLDEANEKGEKALAAHQAYLNDPENFSFKAWGFKDMNEIDEARHFDTTRLEEQIKELDIQEKSLEDIIASYDKTINEYESISKSVDTSDVMDKNEAIAQSFQIETQKMAERERKNAALAAQGVKQSWEDLVADLENLDNELAIKNVTEADYWAQRKQLLEESQYRENAEWHKYYDKVQDYYDKLSETEKKAAEEASKEAEKALKEKQTKEQQIILETMDEMYNKSVSEGKDVGEAAAAAISYGIEKGLDDDKIKTAMENFLKKADIEKALNHKDDDNWYYNQLEKMVGSLEKGSELHDDYYLKLIEGRNKVADNDSKATDKETENAKKKTEELAKLEAKYQSSFGSVFTRNETNGVNGSAGTPYIDTEKMEKTIAAKEKLTGYLEQLAQRGMPQSVINDLLAMDPIKAVEYARILLKVPNKFETVKSLAERDQAAAKKLAVISSIGSSEEFTNAGKVAGTNFSTGFISTVGNLLQTALPNLSGLTVNVGRSETIQSESTKPPAETMNYQSNTERRLENVTILLETIATMMNDSANKKTTLSFNPTIEAVVTMDGETITKKVTQKQEEYQIRTST